MTIPAGSGIGAVGRRPQPWFARERVEAELLGAGWRFSLVFVVAVGGLGGIWPVGVLGAPGVGLAAALADGITAAGVTSLLWVPPIAARCLAGELDCGVRAARVAHGFRASLLRRRGWLALAGNCAAALAAASVAGAVGAIVANVSGSGAMSLGLDGFVGAEDLWRSLVVLGLAAALCAAIVEIAGERRRGLAAIWGTQLLTVGLLAILYFAPVLRPTQFLMPWLGIWPFRSAVTATPLLSSELDRDAGLALAAVWVIALLAVAQAVMRSRTVLPASQDEPE